MGNKFQSTPPSREATYGINSHRSQETFQSTPPSREATGCVVHKRPLRVVSIHAPLTGGDTQQIAACSATLRVSIHAPLTGGDTEHARARRGIGFQSTPPSREATSRDAPVVVSAAFQSTPPSREATGAIFIQPPRNASFNPRPPHGRRQAGANGSWPATLFQSTPPSREATPALPVSGRQQAVSIHAPLTGGDPAR